MLGNNPILEFRGPFRVPVQIDGSFIMLFFALVLIGGRSDMVWALTFFAMLTVSIFLHELGHAWGALVQGLDVRRIVLHGGGGFCERYRTCTPREQELVVAMGPIVNLLLWCIAGLSSEVLFSDKGSTGYLYMQYFANLNLTLAIINLIPVHPMDGGKLFNLALLRVFSYETSARISGAVGLILSILWIPAMVIFYFFFGWFLLFIPSIPLHYRMMRLN